MKIYEKIKIIDLFMLHKLKFIDDNLYIIKKYIRKGVIIEGDFKNIVLHNNCFIEAGAKISNCYGGKIVVGDRCVIKRGAMLLTMGGIIEIGEESSINEYAILYGHSFLKIGKLVRIANHSTLIPSNHCFKDINIPIYHQGLNNKGIIIEDDVWIGSGVRILDGVTIEKGCVIGAGSVVTKSIQEYSVAFGVPAKIAYNRKFKEGNK